MSVWLLLSALMAVLLLPGFLYLGILTLLSVPRAVQKTGQTYRFAVVVPAHNEESHIATTVQNLKAMDYPSHLFEIFVVADNCSDATGRKASDAGAQVLVRQNLTQRGKGFALAYAFADILATTSFEAVVVVDADTLVSPDLLQAFAARLAQGEQALQAEYAVRNPYASWRTRLLSVALGMFHGVRSLGRERLYLSAGLRGNGMCFTTDLLRRIEHKVHSLAEDVEYGLQLGLAGIRVAYVHEAKVFGEMVASGKDSQTQRQRWEIGRRQLQAQYVRPLLQAVWHKPQGLCLDLAIDLILPPLSYLVLALAVGLLWHVALLLLGLGMLASSVSWLWLINTSFLVIYVLRGVSLSGLGWQGVWILVCTPFYIVWKVALLAKAEQTHTWVRTRREHETKISKSTKES